GGASKRWLAFGEPLTLPLLGPDAVITDCAGGGVLAEAPGRRVDLSLATLADRALERNGAEVELLWAP
ncbi:hypothetical protein ACFXOM_24710, partial [Streptomyces sp. NPDC059169]|uniref:hypothetical protein n=1 Tax=Streptomyces sp. NPDC059169 TaxID=3346754 RepID=UPI00368B4937